MSSRRRLGLALLIATLMHGGVAAWIGPAPPKVKIVKKDKDEYAKLKAIREDLKKKEEPPPPPPPPEPEPPPPPPPEEKPPELEKEPPKPPPKKKEVLRPKKKSPDPPPETPPPDVKPPEPAPLVLENVNLTGKVAVQKGDSDIYGDPSVKATASNTRDAPSGDGKGVDSGVKEGVGTAPARPVKRVLPKIKKRVKAAYPEDAPRLGRVIEVTLSLMIGTDGTVQSAKVVKSGGAIFDRAAERTVKRLLFEPGTLGGVPKAMPISWVVAFEPDG